MDFKVELSKSEEERAVRLHKEAMVVDTHSDTLGGLIPRRRQRPRKLGERSETGKIDSPNS